MKFIDSLKTLKFNSVFDGKYCELLLSLPINYSQSRKYPVIISPHPFGWSHFENFSSGPSDLLYMFKGWTGISEKYKVIVALPLGHGRFYEKISMAYEAQIKDITDIPKIIQKIKIRVDENRVFIAGLSMGGMETLTAMGMYPNVFKAGFSFNAITDLAAWYLDVRNGKTDRRLLDYLPLIDNELGGPPEKLPEEYVKRSAVNYIDNFAGANLMIYWSERDSFVTGGKTIQSKRFFDTIKLKYPDSNIYEHDHTFEHGFKKFDAAECIKCHEYSDFNMATMWFLKNW